MAQLWLTHELRIGEILVLFDGDRPTPHVPGDEASEPAFGMKACGFRRSSSAELKRDDFIGRIIISVLLTHLSEVVRNNLAQLLSYKDMRALLDRLGSRIPAIDRRYLPCRISPIRACRRFSSCCWRNGFRSAICISSSKQ